MKIIKYVVAIALVTVSAGPSFSADFKVVSDKYNRDVGSSRQSFTVIEMSGEIESGDRFALKKLIDAQLNGADPWFSPIFLTLNSSGGSFEEAILLGDLLQDSIVRTYIPSTSECYSACAIVFMAGTSNSTDSTFSWRYLHPYGKLGFHSPSLPVASDTLVPASIVFEAHAAGIESMAELVKRSDRFGLMDSLLVQMLTTPPSEMYLIDKVGDANRWDITIDLPFNTDPLNETDLVQLCFSLDAYQSGDLPPSVDLSPQQMFQYGIEYRELQRYGSVEKLVTVLVQDMEQRRCGLLNYDGPYMQAEFSYGNADAIENIFKTSNWIAEYIDRQLSIPPETNLVDIASPFDSAILKYTCQSDGKSSDISRFFNCPIYRQ